MNTLPLRAHVDLCPVCDHKLYEWTIVSGYPIHRCRSCGFALVNPRPTAEELRRYYSATGHGKRAAKSLEDVIERERRFPNSTVDARRIISRMSQLSPGRRFLDVGSGYGFFALAAQSRGFLVDAIEVASFERDCTRQLTGIDPKPVMFEHYEAKAGSYDAILMSQILEHVSDIRLWIAKCRRLLVQGGVLAVAVPNFGSFVRRLVGRRDPLIHPPAHLNYFDAKTLGMLLRSEGLQVRDVRSISRIPGSALTRRMGRLSGKIGIFLQRSVEALERPLLSPLDKLGLGMFLNVFATKEALP